MMIWPFRKLPRYEFGSDDIKSAIVHHKYVYIAYADGMGTQLSFLDFILSRLYRFDHITILFDIRKSDYFSFYNDGFDQDQFNQIIQFNSARVVSDIQKIDQILEGEPEKVFSIAFYQHPFMETYLKEKNVKTLPWDELARLRRGFRPFDSLLRPGSKLTKSLERETHKAEQKLGVHARLGNGEKLYRSEDHNSSRLVEEFIERLDRESGQIFLCTDTLSFLEECIKRYGSRVLHTERFMFPEGCGPGHSVLGCLPEQKRMVLHNKRKELGPYQLIHDAFLEIFLLGLCRRIIGNTSKFSYYARVSRGVPFIDITQKRALNIF